MFVYGMRRYGIQCGSGGSRRYLNSVVREWASKPSSRQSLKSYYKEPSSEERILQSARHVQNELPILLAKEVRNLELLPFIVMTNPHIKQVHDVYMNAFEDIIQVPVVTTSREDKELLLPVLEKVVRGTVNIVELLGTGLKEITERVPSEKLDIQKFLDTFLISRIARRVMAQQHVMLHQPRQNMVGIIALACSPVKCIENVLTIVRGLTERKYLVCPEVKYIGDTSYTFPFIPSHLEYILLELLKNAFRATVEHHHIGKDAFYPTDLPPVKILIATGKDYVTIRISDQGGGIPSDEKTNIWKYGFTTMKKSTEEVHGLGILGTSIEEIHSPMAGLGFGLPLSRLYAKHFGGDLSISTMEGFGTDVYLTLDCTGEALEYFGFQSNTQ
jgi:hypothetical protein